MVIREDINTSPITKTGTGTLSTNSMFSQYTSPKTLDTGITSQKILPTTSGSLFSRYASSMPKTGTSEKPFSFDAPRTSGTFGEVSKAIGGSFGAGVLNLISSAVGTMERQLLAGTDAEGLGIAGMWDNIVKAFSPQATAEERTKVAADIGRAVTNIIKPEQTRTDKEVNTIKDVLNKEGGSTLETGVKGMESAVRKWADVENEAGWVKFASGIGESLPASLATRIPVIGWLLMANQSYRNTIEQTRAEYAAKGEVMPENLATMKALGYAAIEVGTEMLFPLFGKIGGAAARGTLGTATQGLVEIVMKKLGKKTIQEVAELSWKTVGKSMVKEAAGEGVEEILAGLGQAGVAALTTNPDDPYFTLWSKDGGLTSLDALLLQFASGAVMGGAMTGVRGSAQMFTRTKNVVNAIKDNPINEATDDDMQDFKDAITLDMDESDNGEQEFVTDGVMNFIAKAAENQGETFETNTGKLFTVPSANVDASKVSPAAYADVAAMQDNLKAQQAPATAAQPVQQASVSNDVATLQTLQSAAQTFTVDTKAQKVGNFTVSYNAKQKREASINIDTGEITLGRDYFAADDAKKQKVFTHEYAHGLLKQQGIKGADLVASGLFGKLGTINAEEAASQIAADLIVNPDFVAQHPKMPARSKAAYAYVASILPKPEANQAQTVQETVQVTEQVTAEQPKATTKTDDANKLIARYREIESNYPSIRKAKYKNDLDKIVAITNAQANMTNIITKLREMGAKMPDDMQELSDERIATKARVNKRVNEERTKREAADAVRAGQDITEAAQQYVDSEAGQAEFAKFQSDPVALADKVQDIADAIRADDGKRFYHDKRFFEVELEIYRIFSEKLKKMPLGSDMNRYVVHLMEAITMNKPAEVVKSIERRFKASDLYHTIFTDDAAEGEAKEIADRENRKHPLLGMGKENYGIDKYCQNLIRSADTDTIFSKTDNWLLADYAKRLLATPDGAAEARRILQLIGRMATRSGQFSQSIGMIYRRMFPEYQAEMWAREYEKKLNENVPESDRDEHDTNVKKTTEELKKYRKEAGREIGDELDKPIKERKGKIIVNLSAAELFANRIMASLEKRETSVRDDIDRTVTNLFEKYKEVIKYKRVLSKKHDAYNMLIELVINRGKYREAWQDARDVLHLNETMNKGEGMARDNYQTAQNYFTEITDPSFVNRIVNRAVIDTLFVMKKSASDIAKEYFLVGDEAISGFASAIREEVAKAGVLMDDVSYTQLERYLLYRLKSMITERHAKDIEIFAKRYDRTTGKRADLSDRDTLIRELTEAAYRDVFADAESRVSQSWAKRLGVPIVTDVMRQKIEDFSKQIAKAQTENEKDRLFEEMVVMLVRNIPSSMSVKIQAWLRTAMLLNPTTFIRNMLSNYGATPTYKAVDKIANWLLHKVKDLPAEYQIAGHTVRRFNATDTYGNVVMMHTGEATMKRVHASSAKYSLPQMLGMQVNSFKNKYLSAASNIVYDVLATGKYKNIGIKYLGDFTKFQQWYRETMYNALIAMNYNESMPQAEQERIIEIAKKRAASVSTIRTFRMNSIISETIKAVHKVVQGWGSGGKAADLLLTSMVPYVVTPAALAVEMYKFTPIALMKAVAYDLGIAKITGKWNKSTGEYKSKTIQKISQALVGTGTQFVVGMVLFASGLMTGAPPDDPDEKKQWEALGKKPYALYIPGVGYVTIDWLQPISTGLLAGARTLQVIMDKDTSVVGKIIAPIEAPFNVMFKNSLLQNISQQFGIDYQRSEEASNKVVDQVQTMAIQGLPMILKKINAVIDPHVRDVYSGTSAQIMINRVLQYVPGGSFLIPPKIDVWGKPVTQIRTAGVAGGAIRFALNMVSPFTFSPDKMDDTTKEIMRVFNETKSAKALPSIADKTITRTEKGTKKTWDLSAEDWTALQTDIGKKSYDAAKAFIASGRYATMTDDQKATELGKIYSKIGETARDDYVKKHPQ